MRFLSFLVFLSFLHFLSFVVEDSGRAAPVKSNSARLRLPPKQSWR